MNNHQINIKECTSFNDCEFVFGFPSDNGFKLWKITNTTLPSIKYNQELNKIIFDDITIKTYFLDDKDVVNPFMDWTYATIGCKDIKTIVRDVEILIHNTDVLKSVRQKWVLENTYITNLNFGELDCEHGGVQVEMTLRFENIKLYE